MLQNHRQEVVSIEKEKMRDEVTALKNKMHEMLMSDPDIYIQKRTDLFDDLKSKYNLTSRHGHSLKDHQLYCAIIFASFENRKSWLDFSQNEIDNDPKTKEFVEIDLKIKKFIEDEYENWKNSNP